ncbi:MULTISPECIES: ComEC/Rec2 family competence protein [Nocardiaceae]|uniref:ComEC/Rec2 family competence protein n=1 Tax=Nocardiaceae TaxID=85025 RepID=UPI001E2CD276|nr:MULTISPECIES: ComEC/Rec2 family competence protein [Rhodococcus]MCC8927215.1 ComEC family competence protein [Rhodococcus sp. I2R]MCZ4275074.1 ComEC/Rec2 family competence protein [Rhodococcus yunnanensis]
MTEPLVRPYDIRLVPAAVAGWGVTIVGVLFGSGTVAAVAAACGVTAILAALGHSRLGGWATGVVALALIAGCYSGAAALRSSQFESHPVGAAAAEGGWVSAVVEVREDPRRVRFPGPETVSIRAELRRADIAGSPVELGGRVLVMAPAEGWEDVLPGQSITLRGKLAPPIRADLTVAVVRVSGPPLQVDPPGAIARMASVVRESLLAAAADALPPDQAGLLPGLVVGDVSALPESVEDDFRAAGLTHLTAVSGANFAIVLGAVLLATRWIGIGPYWTVAVCAVVLIAFVVIARPSPSVLRAAVMGGIGLLALVTGRRRQAVPALCTAVLALLAWWPQLAVDYGFALSVLATAGLVVVAPVWVDWLRGHGWGRGAAEIVAVAAAAHAVTAPIVAAMAGTFSVVGVLANIAVAPMVAPITVVGALAAVIAPWASAPASWILELASAPLWWLITVAHWSASVPSAGLQTQDGLTGAAVVVAATIVVLVSLRSRVLRWLAGAAASTVLLWWLGASVL